MDPRYLLGPSLVFSPKQEVIEVRISLEADMKTMRYLTLLPLLGGLFLSACDDGGPAEPDFANLSVEDQLTLDLLADPTSVDVALSLADVQVQASNRFGHRWGNNAENLMAQAENAFRNAQGAYAQGDQVRAMKQARIGRELVAEAIQDCSGPQAVQGMMERLQSLPLSVSADPEAYLDPQNLSYQLGELAQGAGNQYRKGNRIQAGGLGVLGEQAIRARQRDGDHAGIGLPEAKVELGAAAILLANQILTETGGTDEDGYLVTAQEYQDQAQAIIDSGAYGGAMHYAHLAQWWALRAIVDPAEATSEEVGDLLSRAQSLYDAALAALGDEPTELQTILLERAAAMLANGEANMSEEACGGIMAVWQAAVVFSYLAG